ncbi:MAG: MBOAT family protein [Lachnospiraceae bacterium]|jgi:alginate O-acetyltransferase complex protein AlgI|nr:MBOAT family protein [Lachnospiraceae bacterium]
MSLISMEFLLFVIAAVTGYYLIPRRFQWVWLLAFSYIYYVSGGIRVTCFLLFTTVTTYFAGRWMEQTAQSMQDKKEEKKRKKQILAGTLILNFGVLGVLKYTNFMLDTISSITGGEFEPLTLLLPLGISFYTFQSMGYLLDVYWGRSQAEHNLFRFALFVSFFPQILQGPIGRFGSLGRQLYASHSLDRKNIEGGFLRILWGYFKKMVIADNAVIFVNAIFDHPDLYDGLGIVGVLAYSIQLYCDFSGGMDVVLGIAKLFGIQLDENFKRPYFAVSITDFWHRWHITLGTWMKDYVFYPASLSGWMKSFSKFAKKTFGKQTGRTLPICLANLIVFLVVGVWHGAAWKFIIYGLYNGLIIAFSGLMAPSYRKWKKALHISDDSRVFHLFQIFRTFVLVNISWYFDRAGDVKTALLMMKHTLTKFDLRQILEPGIDVGEASGTAYTMIALGVILGGCLLLFLVSVLQERGKDLTELFIRQNWMVKAFVYLCLILALPVFGQPSGEAGGFIYAQF